MLGSLPAAMIAHSRPTLSEADVQRVAAVVRSGQIAQGPEVEAFERELAAFVGQRGAAAVSSGSAALHLALLALGAGPDTEVVIPTYVCDALYHAVSHCGATPVLADAEPATLSLDPDDVKRRLTARTAAVILPHAFGLAAGVEAFLAMGVPVIEDCAQAIGALDGARPVGRRGALAIFSFYATKMLTTGEGGMVVAGDPALLARVRDLREYDERTDLAPRFNYKLTDLQAALGRSQLARLPEFIARRRAVARAYRRALAGLPCRLPPDDAGGRHVYHRFVIGVECPLDPLIAQLEGLGVRCRRPVFRPLHRALGRAGYPRADTLWEQTLSLPCYPSLTDGEVRRVTEAVAETLERR
ncbi:MAG: DegT/DnrJ/EryC1/StrS aminotransferase family protein [Candidatus Rokubacteria bacterium]|nr:DegT/DnrJ/EryC1/StrS aminotransferase family protein [Candidatus Rokubacteria bacterium]